MYRRKNRNKDWERENLDINRPDNMKYSASSYLFTVIRFPFANTSPVRCLKFNFIFLDGLRRYSSVTLNKNINLILKNA